jgi:hypothetical protein
MLEKEVLADEVFDRIVHFIDRQVDLKRWSYEIEPESFETLSGVDFA